MPRPAGGARPRTLTGRLLLWHSIAMLSVLLALGVVVDRVLEGYFVGQLTDSLVADARAVQQALPASTELERRTLALGRALGARITIIRTDGVVLSDSEHDPATMENHRNRPEVQEALHGRIGGSSRESATLGVSFRYVALPPAGGRIVRVAVPLTTVRGRLRTVRVILGTGFGLAAMAGLIALYAIARRVSRPLRRMATSVERVGHGDLATEVPETGTQELVALARTVNHMRRDVASRMAVTVAERRVRDAILSALEEGVVLFDGTGSVLYLNQSAARLLGSSFRHARNLATPALRDALHSATDGAPRGRSR
jgi:two-component system, OmpR family, phosphate regulon sensor histidine kinase PhoR